jgi:hypothetical protein
MAKSQYSGPWRRIRKHILERDNHLCQIRGAGCTVHATEVDHIVPISKGGSWYDPTNLRGSCVTCNNKRVDRKRTEGWRTARTRIVLVVGPPGAGKTTWVNENKGEHDLVVDYDSLAAALGSPVDHNHSDSIHTATMAARNAVLTSLRKGAVNIGRAWIISSNPRAEDIFPFHTVVTVDPGREVVEARVRNGLRPEHFLTLVANWYDARQEHKESTLSSRTW